MIISFALTTGALLDGEKDTTRREWDGAYALRFRCGQVCQAWSRSPRFHGQHVADIRLRCRPHLEPVAQMPDRDYKGEGFAWLYAHPEHLPKAIWGRKVTREDFAPEAFPTWRQLPLSLWVVRFELVDITKAGEELQTQLRLPGLDVPALPRTR